MKRILSTILLLWGLVVSQAASYRITATLTITNVPANGYTMVVNGSTRTWATSVTTPATQIVVSNTVVACKTNLLTQLTTYSFSGPTITTDDGSTNKVLLTGQKNQAMVVTVSTNWATVSYITNTVYDSYALTMPFTIETNSLRTNLMDWLSGNLSTYATTSIVSGSAIASQLVGLTNAQTISGKKVFTGQNIHTNLGWIQFVGNDAVMRTNGIVFSKSAASLSAITNYTISGDSGGWPNITDSSNVSWGPIVTTNSANAYFPWLAGHTNQWTSLNWMSQLQVTNLTALGGTGTNLVFTGSTYSGYVGSLTNGTWVAATLGPRVDATATGTNASANAPGAIAIGWGAAADGVASIAIGYGSGVDGTTNAVAIGNTALAGADNSVAIGRGASTTTPNEIRIGSASHTVRIGGQIADATSTNTTLNGFTDVNQSFNLKLNTHTTLASGANSGVVFTNCFNRITGPAGAFSIAGIAGGRNGRVLILYNTTTQNMTISNDSGTEATATNRIYTLTGSDIATVGTGAVTMVYDTTAQRWIVTAIRD